MDVCIIEQKAKINTMKTSLKLLLYDFYVVVVGEVESRKVKTKKKILGVNLQGKQSGT